MSRGARKAKQKANPAIQENKFKSNVAKKKNAKKLTKSIKTDLNKGLTENSNILNYQSQKVVPTSIKNNKNPKQSTQVLPTTSSSTASSSSTLKYIIIDGSNVAMEHGKVTKSFSPKGIQLTIEYFLRRGHKDIKALVPRYRRKNNALSDNTLLDDLERKGYLSYTPSRYLNGKLIVPYDDRFILEAAEHYNAVIVSNDNYNDIKNENSRWRQLVDNKYVSLLQFTFVGDLFLVAKDPMGRNGPNLDQFLQAPNVSETKKNLNKKNEIKKSNNNSKKNKENTVNNNNVSVKRQILDEDIEFIVLD